MPEAYPFEVKTRQVLVVDWSANSRPKRGADSIWISDAFGWSANPPTRMEAMQLIQERTREGNWIVAFDFPMGIPFGVGDFQDWRSFWHTVSSGLRDEHNNQNNRWELAALLNDEYNTRFWGVPQDRPNLSSKRGHEAGEWEWRVGDPRGAQSAWKLLGVGSVGSQMLTGIAHLERWRQQDPASFSVWPFEASKSRIVLTETWPSHPIFARAQQSVRDIHPSAVRDEVQTQSTASVLQKASTSDDLLNLKRVRKEAMSDSFGTEPWRLSPEVRAERLSHITTMEGWILLPPESRANHA